MVFWVLIINTIVFGVLLCVTAWDVFKNDMEEALIPGIFAGLFLVANLVALSV